MLKIRVWPRAAVLLTAAGEGGNLVKVPRSLSVPTPSKICPSAKLDSVCSFMHPVNETQRLNRAGPCVSFRSEHYLSATIPESLDIAIKTVT